MREGVTPSARHAGLRGWVLAAGLVASAMVSCKDDARSVGKHADDTEPPNPSRLAATLDTDAEALTEPADPVAPAGDLKGDLDHFVNIDTCVAERAKLDPLVFDALSSLGYDTFLRDACRLLAATKDRSPSECAKIDASELRARCQAWVAMASETPTACPMVFATKPAEGRTPTCVAVASRDPRLCAGEARTQRRATCEALATHEDARCDVLLPRDRALCKRELERWGGLLGPTLAGLTPLPAPKATLTLRGRESTPDPLSTEVDVSSDFARGAVVVRRGLRLRVATSSIGEGLATRFASGPNRTAHVDVAVTGIAASEAHATNDGKRGEPMPKLERLAIDVPGQAPLVCEDGGGEAAGATSGTTLPKGLASSAARCDVRVRSGRLDEARGGAVELSLAGTVRDGARAYDVAFALTTFVRDVVTEDPLTRSSAFGPLHPRVPAPKSTRDAGTPPNRMR